MRLFKFTHYNLPEYKYAQHESLLLLTSRDNEEIRDTFTLDELLLIKDKQFSIYPTTGMNKRIKSLGSVEFYTQGTESQFFYFRHPSKLDFIFLHQCDLDKIISQQTVREERT